MQSETKTEEVKTDTPQVETEQVIQEPKKRRGRPPKNPDAVNISGDEKKTTRKPTKKKTSKVIEGKQIAGLHAVAAHLTGIPELVISDQEGDLLASGLQAVAEEYGLELGGKTGAAIQLLSAAAVVYLPRFAAFTQKQKAMQNERKDENAAPH